MVIAYMVSTFARLAKAETNQGIPIQWIVPH